MIVAIGLVNDSGKRQRNACKDKIAKRRQITKQIEWLSHETPPGQGRLAKWLKLQLEGEASVRLRLERRELTAPRKGGQHKRGKRLPHIELIYRALVYDAARVSSGDTDWLAGPIRRGRLEEVLELLENEETQDDLIHALPRLPIAFVEVDADKKRVTFGFTDRHYDRPPVTFRTIENHISKLRRTV